MAIGDLSRKKKSRGPDSAAAALEQIEGVGDRIANWCAAHIVPLLIAAALVLLATAAIGYWSSRSEDSRGQASLALAAVHQGYLKDMGASPGDLLATEPANPETAAQVRRQYAEAYGQVRIDHPGTPESLIAGLEQGNLQKALGEPEVAVAIWAEVLPESAAVGVEPLRGLLLTRLGNAAEERGDWPAAAVYYEEAGNLAAFPLASSALSAAARSYAEAGQPDRAIAVYDQRLATSERPVAPHIRTRIEELRARASREP